jgi:chromosome segregation ATPase
MLTSTDIQMGVPQLVNMKRQMGTEVWSTDYYGANGWSNANGEWSSSGSSGTIAEIQERIKDLENQLRANESQLNTAKANYANALARYQACENTDCRGYHSAKRCNSCREQPRSDMSTYSSRITSYSVAIKQIKADIADWKEALQEAEQIAVELVAQGKELAQYGETPESILAKTQAKAKNRRLIIGAGVGVALLFTGIYVFYKIRKNKRS